MKRYQERLLFLMSKQEERSKFAHNDFLSSLIGRMKQKDIEPFRGRG